MDTADQTPHEGPKSQRIFLLLSGLFLGTMAMLNILGLTRFIDLSFPFFGNTIPVYVAVGTLPYPLTFLCTDLISELYGKRRANDVVWMGLILNAWVISILWLGGVLPAVNPSGQDDVFMSVRSLAFAAVFASMAAYLVSQFVDVQLFHFWKTLTKGRHLWLRNNGSTIFSQLIDSVLVVLITYWIGGLPIEQGQPVAKQLWIFVVSGYGFKLATALADTIPFYLAVRWLGRYLKDDKPVCTA